jgi:hypothetical protein
MPIKQVVCSICKETVNKAVTYHVGGTDRACKKHEGVVETKGTLEAAKEKASQMSLQKAEHRQAAYTQTTWSQDYQTPKCWVCMNTGVRQREFFLRVLVEMQKQEKIHGGPVNPFDAKNMIVPKDRCIFILPKEKIHGMLKFVREDFRQIVDMAGMVSVCGPCCGTLKIEAMPEVKWEDLSTGMVLSEMIKPVLSEIAGRELARDN